MKRIVIALVFFAVLIAAWQFAFNARIWSPVLVPSPQSVARYLWDNTFNPGSAVQPNPNQWQLFFAIGVTLKRLLAGYVIGLAVGLPLGLITARFRPARDTLGVLALGLQGLPSVCWVPLALLWFGQTEGAMLFIVSGMKQGWAFAWRSLMAAEIFVSILTGFGLGQMLHNGRELNAMDQVIGIMVVIVLIGLLADKVIFSPWENFLHRRWGTSK
jgi:NitT/TauT family transport system permease protein